MIEDPKEVLSRLLKNKYVLTQIVQFGEWEVEQIENDIAIGDSEEELKGLCKKNGWELNNPTGWNEYYIRKVT